jgi:hypothetical protein
MKRMLLFGWLVVSVIQGEVDLPAPVQGESPFTAQVVSTSTWRVDTRAQCESLRVLLETNGMVPGPCMREWQSARSREGGGGE